MKNASLSALLSALPAHFTQDRVSVGDVVKALPHRNLDIMLLFFALIIALPLPTLPGMNTVLALPLLFITVQQMLGWHEIWLPRYLREKSISKPRFDAIAARMIPWALRGERFLKPRLSFLTHGVSLRIIGLCGFIMAACIAVPFPFSNTVPSACIAVMTIGVIMQDGLAVLFGALAGLIWVFLLTWLGAEGVMLAMEWMRSWM